MLWLDFGPDKPSIRMLEKAKLEAVMGSSDLDVVSSTLRRVSSSSLLPRLLTSLNLVAFAPQQATPSVSSSSSPTSTSPEPTIQLSSVKSPRRDLQGNFEQSQFLSLRFSLFIRLLSL